jgi:hypothetical protein
MFKWGWTSKPCGQAGWGSDRLLIDTFRGWRLHCCCAEAAKAAADRQAKQHDQCATSGDQSGM